MCISTRIGTFLRGQSGNVLIETAFLLPIMLTMLAGVLDVGRLLLTIQKMDRAASTYADLVAREDSVTTASLSQAYDAVEQVTAPYDFANKGVAFVTSVRNNGGNLETVWQYDEGGLTGRTSQVGSPGSVPNLPTGFTLSNGDSAIVGEVYFEWTPLFFPDFITDLFSSSSKWNSSIGGFELYYYHYFRPRTVAQIECSNC
ncbi:MAG: pilus assembly protein [Alphaproteobacteria bacterium]|nr:pilus assembly protein [Alphaproteobacteria bacterium]